jgi:iron-sulfur cluster repair protein YtfE (RIC family)
MSDADPIHDAAELTRHIETRYHARHCEQLPLLAAMAEKVENVHFGDDHVPDRLSDVLRRMVGEMEVLGIAMQHGVLLDRHERFHPPAPISETQKDLSHAE